MYNQNNYSGNDYQDNTYKSNSYPENNYGYSENNYPGNGYPEYYPPENNQPQKKNILLPVVMIVLGVIIIGLLVAIIIIFAGGKNDEDSTPATEPAVTQEALTEAEETTLPPAPQTTLPRVIDPPPAPKPPAPPAVDYSDTMSIYRAYRLNGHSLYIRSGPSQGYKVIGKVYAGYEVGVTGWSGDWAYVTMNFGYYGWSNGSSGSSMSGWIHGGYLTHVAY